METTMRGHPEKLALEKTLKQSFQQDDVHYAAQREEDEKWTQVRDAVMFFPPPPFKGRQDDDFRQWLKRFNRWALCCRYDDLRKCEILPVLLEDRAEYAYDTVPREVRGDFNALTERLMEKLQPPRLSDLKSIELHSRQQRLDETVNDFAYDIQTLTRLAYPELSTTVHESLMKRLFLNGLTPSLRKFVMINEPPTFDAAVTAARRQEAQEEFTFLRYSLPQKPNLQPTAELMNRIRKLELTVEERNRNSIKPETDSNDDASDQEAQQSPNGYNCQLQAPRRTRQQQPYLHWSDREQPRCWQCNRPGHKQSECLDLLLPKESLKHDEQEIQIKEIRRIEDKIEALRLQNECLQEQLCPKRVAGVFSTPTVQTNDSHTQTKETNEKIRRLEEDNAKLNRVADEAKTECRRLKQQLNVELRDKLSVMNELIAEREHSQSLENQLTWIKAKLGTDCSFQVGNDKPHHPPDTPMT